MPFSKRCVVPPFGKRLPRSTPQMSASNASMNSMSGWLLSSASSCARASSTKAGRRKFEFDDVLSMMISVERSNTRRSWNHDMRTLREQDVNLRRGTYHKVAARKEISREFRGISACGRTGATPHGRAFGSSPAMSSRSAASAPQRFRAVTFIVSASSAASAALHRGERFREFVGVEIFACKKTERLRARLYRVLAKFAHLSSMRIDDALDLRLLRRHHAHQRLRAERRPCLHAGSKWRMPVRM